MRRPIFFGALIVALAAVIIGRNYQSCSETYRNDVVVRAPKGSAINAQVAMTQAEREKGLSGRKCIGAQTGMLFIFDKPGNYAFWMKDMRFPIDIIWLSDTKKVVQLDSSVQPNSYPNSLLPAYPAKYVLEMAAGQAAKDNISFGSQLSF